MCYMICYLCYIVRQLSMYHLSSHTQCCMWPSTRRNGTLLAAYGSPGGKDPLSIYTSLSLSTYIYIYTHIQAYAYIYIYIYIYIVPLHPAASRWESGHAALGTWLLQLGG